MKERTPEQLKGQIRSFAEKRKLQPQEVLQMFLIERFLERLAKSSYKNNFILKNYHGYGYYGNWNQYGRR